jgi:hypothetical protein
MFRTLTFTILMAAGLWSAVLKARARSFKADRSVGLRTGGAYL